MSWLRKICKGSSHKNSKEHHKGKSNDNEDGVCNEPTNSLLLSGYESEDLSLAVALSLSEEELKKSISSRTKSNVDEDELARALQESLNTKSPPPENKESHRICAGCENELGLGKFLSLMGAFWHRECFSCYACGQPIIGDVSMKLEFSTYGDHHYHKSCCRNLYHPKCDVCKEFVPIKNGEFVFQEIPFWMQMSCPSHEHDGTQNCFSCHRKRPQGANYSKLDDRAMICLECLDSSIMNSATCQPLYGDILKFYKGLNMDFGRGQIQLLLVESRVLLSEVQNKDGHPLDDIAGLCRLNTQNDQIKFKRPKISIFLLKGLPRILTGLNLAHEMMHAWLFLNGCLKLDSRVEEGICVVLSYMWLDIEMRSGSDNNDASSSSSSSSAPYRKDPRSQFERKFGEYCRYNLENHPYPIYKDGFRLGYAAVVKYGLRSVLDHIKLTGNFPC